VVKDDAYGHDAAVVVPELLKIGITKICSGLCKMMHSCCLSLEQNGY